MSCPYRMRKKKKKKQKKRRGREGERRKSESCVEDSWDKSYKRSFNGFAAKLTERERQRLAFSSLLFFFFFFFFFFF